MLKTSLLLIAWPQLSYKKCSYILCSELCLNCKKKYQCDKHDHKQNFVWLTLYSCVTLNVHCRAWQIFLVFLQGFFTLHQAYRVMLPGCIPIISYISNYNSVQKYTSCLYILSTKESDFFAIFLKWSRAIVFKRFQSFSPLSNDWI